MEHSFKEIAGKRYKLVYLTATDALKVLTRLTRLFGPSLAQLVTADRSNPIDVERATSEAFAIFSTSVRDEDLDALRRAFGDVTWYLEGDREQLLSYAVQDLHFRGRPLALFQWLWASLQWNFADFFEGAMPLLGALGVKKAQPSSESPTGSIGGSGE